jgi:hypothetical protein
MKFNALAGIGTDKNCCMLIIWIAFIFDTMGITGTESAPPATRVATVMPMPLFAEKIVYSTSA